ncbi:MAG: Gfo/Idh/MocA family oxidoreductase [Deltaproteobacteria bacterium]|nr:Gfo/Idh/MocA family oxidoreductase [Deltaproteobacteria bacterium]
MPPSPLRLLLVGAGTMARVHARAARTLDRELSLHVADPSPKARAAFAKRFPEASLHDDADEMLALPRRPGDLAIVATPPGLHREYIEAAARSGRPVLCEKPLLMSRDEIEGVADTLRETRTLLSCCSIRFLANPANRRVADLVQSGALGEIYGVRWLQGGHRMRSGIEYQPESPFFLDRSRNGGGVLMDWAAYDLCILQDILQPRAIRILHAKLVQPELPADPAPTGVFDVETHAIATLVFETDDGLQVPVHFERQSGSFERDLSESTLSGTRGSVSWTCMGWEGDIELTLRNAEDEEGKPQILEPPGPGWVDHAPLKETLRLMEALPNRALAGANALYQAATLRALYEAAETGREIVVSRDHFDGVPTEIGGR